MQKGGSTLINYHRYPPIEIVGYQEEVDRQFKEEKEKSRRLLMDIEEEVTEKIEIPKTPPIVQIGLVQNLCNLRCKQCWIPEIIKEGAIPNIMDGETFSKIIGEVAKIDEKYQTQTPIRFLGSGESLLDPEIIEKIKYAKEKIKGAVCLITNGQRLHKKRCGKGKTLGEELLHTGIDLIDISIDAVNERTYQLLRGDPNHTYEHLVKNTVRLISTRNEETLPTTIIGSFLIQPENFNQTDTFKNTWGKILDRYILRKYHSYRGNIQSKTLSNKNLVKGPCAAPFGRLNIASNGIIIPCYLDWKQEMPLANIKEPDTSIETVWQNQMKEFQEAHLNGEKPKFCKDCDGYEAAHKGELSYQVLIKQIRAKIAERRIFKFNEEDVIKMLLNNS